MSPEFSFNVMATSKIASLNTPLPWFTTNSDTPIKVGWGSVYEDMDIHMECGFFHNAMWLDKRGLYLQSSLRDPSIIEYIKAYNPPVDIIDSVLALPPTVNSKYKQPATMLDWPGVMLLGQSLMDNSVSCVGEGKYDINAGIIRYMDWYRLMCDTYKDKLYVKIHPFVAEIKPYAYMLKDIAREYKTKTGLCNMESIRSCDKVLVYNSTAIVDCWMRGVTVEQHAKGTFDQIPNELGKQMVNFLMWKYCIPLTVSAETLREILHIYTSTDDLWPLPEHLSWGQWAVDNLLNKEQ